MRNVKIIIALSALVVVVPFSGLPSSWKTAILVLLGAIITFLAFRLLPTRKNSVDGNTSSVPPARKEKVEEVKESEDVETEESHG